MADLRAAYLATEFAFTAQGKSFVMRIGEQNPGVRDLLSGHGVPSAAFITACNPASQSQSEEQNTLAMRALKSDLEADDSNPLLKVFDGAGRDPKGTWPPEQSFMILGINRPHAEMLGQKYGQNAIVWVEGTGIPALVELVDLDKP